MFGLTITVSGIIIAICVLRFAIDLFLWFFFNGWRFWRRIGRLLLNLCHCETKTGVRKRTLIEVYQLLRPSEIFKK